MEFTPDIIITNRVNADYVEYDESSSNPVVDQFFSDITCGNKDNEILLFENIGYDCCRTNKFHLAFILKGSGGNGKSTYFKIIKTLLGDSAASIRLKKVTTDKFASTSLYGKTCAIADDINNGKDVDTGLLKTLISGDGIRAEYKFENEFEFEPYATILIGMNNIVTFNDSSNGFARRFKIIPFNHTFEGTDRNNNMKEILCTPKNLQYICSKAMYYFNKVIKRDGFTISEDVESETKSYLKENRIVEQFVDEMEIDGLPAKEVQDLFKIFCEDNGYRKLSPQKLRDELKNLYYEKGRATKPDPNGKRPYLYTYTGKKKKDVLEMNSTVDIEQINNYNLSSSDFSEDFDLSCLNESEEPKE